MQFYVPLMAMVQVTDYFHYNTIQTETGVKNG
jgi:hypothetical protein